MKEKEMIPVFIRVVNGRTACLCKQDAKRCKMPCERDVVTRDKFVGWENTMRRNKFGK